MMNKSAFLFQIDTKLMTACSYHVTYAFQRELTLYSCLNVKGLLARGRCEIGSLNDCNWIRTHDHLVHKRTLNHLGKLAKLIWLNGSSLVAVTKLMHF